MDSAFCAGASLAAKSLRYERVAELILADGLDAYGVVRLFALSASKSSSADAALILLAGSVARYRHDPSAWSGEPERSMAEELLGKDRARFQRLAARASTLIVKNWEQMAAR
jgi:hypothetical protein